MKITILVMKKKVELFQLLVEFNVQDPREAFFHKLASEKKGSRVTQYIKAAPRVG